MVDRVIDNLRLPIALGGATTSVLHHRSGSLGWTQSTKSDPGAPIPSEAAPKTCHPAISRNITFMTLKVLDGRILPLGARSTCQCAASGDQCKE